MMGNLLAYISKASMLGFWDTIKEGLEDFASGILMNTLGHVLWSLCDIFFIILDMFQALFNQIAGISSSIRGMDGNRIEGDIVLYLVQSNIVQQVFMSIFILSLFLLIIFTIFAIVKNQYSDKQEPVSKIINSSVKALLMYLLVPVATIVCLIVGNVVLEAINDATKSSGATSLSGMVFTTASYNANKLRDGEAGEAGLESNRARLEIMIWNGKLNALKPQLASIGINSASDAKHATAEEIEYIATLVDEYYVQGKLWVGEKTNILLLVNVNEFYNLWRISYITVWIGGGFLIWAIGKITWGLVSRMFKVTLYYAISPAVMATFPIDNGGALGKWRSEMVKNVTMGYTAVGVMNVLYSVLPFIHSIKFVDAGVLKLFLVIVAFSSAKDLIGSISGWFGTGDALSEGIKAKSQWDAAQKKAGGIATKAIGRYGGIRGGIEDAAKRGEKKWKGALQGFYGTTDAYKKQQEAAKAFLDGKEGYKGTRKNLSTQFGINEDAVTIYEAQEAIEKEKKAIGLKIAQMEKVRDDQLAAATAAGATSDELDEIKNRWKKAIEKQKESASFLASLYEDRQLDIDSRQKDLEKRQSRFSAFSSFEEKYGLDQSYRSKIESLSGWTGMSDAIWEEIKSGDFTHVAGGFKKKVQDAYTMYASDIASNEQDMSRTRNQIVNLANSGASEMKYVKSVLGDTIFSKLLNVTETDTDGNATKVELSVTANTASAEVAKKVQDEQSNITKITAKISQDIDSLKIDKKDKYGVSTYTQDEYLKIGKSQGKK